MERVVLEPMGPGKVKACMLGGMTTGAFNEVTATGLGSAEVVNVPGNMSALANGEGTWRRLLLLCHATPFSQP